MQQENDTRQLMKRICLKLVPLNQSDHNMDGRFATYICSPNSNFAFGAALYILIIYVTIPTVKEKIDTYQHKQQGPQTAVDSV